MRRSSCIVITGLIIIAIILLSMARDLQQRGITFKQQTPLIVCNFVHGPLLFKGKDDDDDCLRMGTDSFSFFSKVEEEVRLLNEESYVLLFLLQDSQSLLAGVFTAISLSFLLSVSKNLGRLTLCFSFLCPFY